MCRILCGRDEENKPEEGSLSADRVKPFTLIAVYRLMSDEFLN
jgi:hypothetical protein